MEMEHVFTLRDGATDVMSVLVGRVVWAVSVMRHRSTDQTYKRTSRHEAALKNDLRGDIFKSTATVSRASITGNKSRGAGNLPGNTGTGGFS